MGKRSKKSKIVSGETTELYDKITKTETQIIDKFAQIHKNHSKKQEKCLHDISDEQRQCPPYDSSQNYYQLFWKTFLLNRIKMQKIEKTQEEVSSLEQSLKWVERKFEKYQKIVSYRKPKTFSMNQKKTFSCSYPGCNRKYSSKGPLELHQQLKHKKQKQQIIKEEFDPQVFFQRPKHREN